MKLSLQEAAQLLQVSDRTVARWTTNLGMPHETSMDGPVFDRSELIEWANAHSFRLAMEVPGEHDSAVPSMASALQQGRIHYEVAGRTVEDALGEIAYSLPLPELVDREFFHQVLIAREDLGSTGVGEGIAIPHVRSPLVIHVEEPLVGLFFLERAVDWNAIDGKPVDTLFTVVSPGVRPHLHCLSMISFALRDPELRGLLSRRADTYAIIDRFQALDGLRKA
ncbi:MAG: PTS sugar transporter subunit IIA [Planctomycetota bacterium]